MTQEHKDALAQGRAEARAIKAYLKALAARRPGRPVTRESLNKRLATIREKLGVTEDVLRRVELIQSRLEIEGALAEVDQAVDFVKLEAGFVKHAASYSERKDISYTAWREFGVPPGTLKTAGIPETRRR
jgi:hypothetical protein